MGFWQNFWKHVKKILGIETRDGKVYTNVRRWDDISQYNPLDVVVSKLCPLVNDEATFDIESDSVLVGPLKELCAELEAKRYDICSMMLGKGGCFVTMATNDKQDPYHRYVSPDDVSVYAMDADKMVDVAIVIDKKTVNHKEYRLVRHHYLDENGTLYICYYIVDENGNERHLPEWEHFKEDGVAISNANHIGVAYFKSPKDSRGLSPVWGVPFNFGCEETEGKFIQAKQMLFSEMENAQNILFVDETIARVEDDTADPKKRHYKLTERMYTIRKKHGVDGSLIDVYAPNTRETDFERNMVVAGHDYEDQMGLNAGFVTPPEYTAGATATEIKSANAKTISMMKKIQTAMFEGINDTLEMDGVFLNIGRDLWMLKVDWFNPFEDETAQYERLLAAAGEGYAEKEDVVRWLFPNLSPEEIEEKLARISERKQADTSRAIDDIFAGR